MVVGELVECECCREHAASGIRYSEQFEVALEDSVLSWCSVNGDVGEVRIYLLVAFNEREVMTVYR